MWFAPIVPISMLNRIKDDSYHMVLAPLCRDKTYFNFYSKVQGFKMLDNGAAEGDMVDIEELLRLHSTLGCNELIVPDEYGDMHGTLRSLRKHLPFVETVQTQVVLQCRSWIEFHEMLNEALIAKPSAVALPRVMTRYLGPHARLQAAEKIRTTSDIPIHALGSTTNLHEARELARQEIVRGIDSSAPVANGLAKLTLMDTYTGRQPDFFKAKSNKQVEVNLDQFRSWCETPPARKLRVV
jgi:hypothetical protein